MSQGRPSYYDYAPPVRTSRDHLPEARASTEHADGTRVVTIRQRSPPRKARDDDYHVRPRIRTNSLDPESSRRPLSLLDPRSPAKVSRPVITREGDGPSSPLPKNGGAQLEASYIVPASSSGRHHQRRSSLTSGDRLPVRDRDRERIYPGNQGSTAGAHRTRGIKDERDYNIESITPKEQVLRDLAPPQPRLRSGSHTGARPTSMVEFDRPEKGYARTERDAPPPPSTRGFDNINRKESLKSNTRLLDDDLGRRDSASKRYPREERGEPRYRDIPRLHTNARDDYVAYPPETSRHIRPRQPTLEIEAPQKDRSLREERDDSNIDRNRKHQHYQRGHGDLRDGDESHGRHRRRDHDERDERLRRKDYIETEERDRRREYDDRYDRDQRKGYDDRDDRVSRRHLEDKEEKDRRREYDERPYRTRDEIRDRDRGEEGSEAATQLGLLTAGGTAAAAGLAAEGVRRHRHKDEDERPSKDAHSYHANRDRTPEAPSASVLTEEEEREERRRRRRREREREERYGREAIEAAQRPDPEEREPLRIEAPPAGEPVLRQQKSYERPPERDEPGRRRRRRRHRHRSPSQATDSRGEGSDSSDSESSTDHVVRTPRVVSPPNDTSNIPAARAPPKGILKQPRVRFPEEPQTVREGVAPLDAAKKGIPLEARWTRINRKLVNPEALDQEGIRFEEYPEYVIVLKVLSQEDIAKFTQRTHEIREKRRLEQGSQGSGSGSGAGPLGEDVPPA